MSSPRCAELQRLVLDTCEIDSSGVSLLIASPAWQTLRVLQLSRNPLGASAIRALAAAPPPAQLHTLELDDADLDEAAGTALGKVPWLGKLAVLALSGNMLGRGAAGLRTIAPDAVRSLRINAIGPSEPRPPRSRSSGRTSSSSRCRTTRSPMPASSVSSR